MLRGPLSSAQRALSIVQEALPSAQGPFQVLRGPFQALRGPFKMLRGPFQARRGSFTTQTRQNEICFVGLGVGTRYLTAHKLINHPAADWSVVFRLSPPRSLLEMQISSTASTAPYPMSYEYSVGPERGLAGRISCLAQML